MEKEQFDFLRSEIADLKEDMDEVKGDVKEILINHLPHMMVEIATLKVKAGIWGAIAGALPATIISVIAFLIMLSQFGT